MPYIGERSGGKRRLQDTEEASALIINTLKSLASSSTHLLMIGAAKVPFVYMLNGFMNILIETGKHLHYATIAAERIYIFINSEDI